MIRSGFFLKRPVFSATIGGLILSWFHKSYIEGGGLLFSNPSLYGRGFPAPYLVWKLSWPKNAPDLLSLEQVAKYTDARTLLVGRGLWGLGIDIIFWFVVSLIAVGIGQKLLRDLDTRLIKKICLSAIILTSLTIFLTSQDIGQGIVISRGAPLSFLDRQSIAHEPYWTKYPEFNPFTFVVDVIFFCTVILIGYKTYQKVGVKRLKIIKGSSTRRN